MSIKVESTTDSKEAAAMTSELASKGVDHVEDKPASVEKTDETPKDSETLESKEATELEAKDSDEDISEEKSGQGSKRKIKKLVSKLTEREREIEYLKSERNEYLKNKKTEPEKPAAPEVKSEGRPKAEDFEKHEDFVEALTDWKLDKKLLDRDAKTKESTLKTEQQKQIDSHWTKVNEFKKSHDDFDELLEDVNDVQISITVQQSILESDQGAELMYQLAKHKDEYKRICALPAIAAARELGKFEAKFLTSSEEPLEEPKEPKTTKAPTPITPVKTISSGTAKKLSDPSLTQSEYEQIRREQMARKRA